MQDDANSMPPLTPIGTGLGPKKSKLKAVLTFIAVLLAVGGTAAAVYFWRDEQAKQQLASKTAEAVQLEEQNKRLTSQLKEKDDEIAAAKKAAEDTKNDAPVVTVSDAIDDAMSSKKYDTLEKYMASTIRLNVVLASAGGGAGSHSSAEAVASLESSLKDATLPWDFSLSASELDTYQSGSYSSYFPTGAFVGKSKNGYVVTFTFNSVGKINSILIASNASLLL